MSPCWERVKKLEEAGIIEGYATDNESVPWPYTTAGTRPEARSRPDAAEPMGRPVSARRGTVEDMDGTPGTR